MTDTRHHAGPASSAPDSAPDGAPDSLLARNLVGFARVLRAAGMALGTGQVLDAVRAVAAVDIGEREQFYWALHAALVSDHRQHALFHEAFVRFFRAHPGIDDILAALLPRIETTEPRMAPGTRRVAEALRPPGQDLHRREPRPDALQLDAVMTYSDEEVLRTRDFAQMSADEIRRARQIIARMRLTVAALPTRRFGPDPRGSRIDLRAALRASVRSGSGTVVLPRRSQRKRPPPLVALCDISGSMERYAQMLLHFLHALTSHRERVHSFVFGTRLTNITRQLRGRDVDLALARVGRAVTDWSGGTRIGPCLVEFNRTWSRRVLGQGAVVLLITDGLDRDPGPALAQAMDRLHRSSRRLIWLNPLLGYDAFEPRARGIQAMLPHVDEFRPVHDLASLRQLAEALG